jgi:hypothetical protein
MDQYQVTDERDDTYYYEASDMRMALVVHHQLVGTESIRCERIPS